MSRLADLRSMRDFLDREIAAELGLLDDITRADEMVNAVALLYSVSVDDILLGDQRHTVARARRGLAWLLRRRGIPLRDVAQMVGYSYEDTVSHACRRVDHDPAARALLIGLEAAS